MKKLVNYLILTLILGLSIIVIIPGEGIYTKVANYGIEKTVHIIVTYDTFDVDADGTLITADLIN